MRRRRRRHRGRRRVVEPELARGQQVPAEIPRLAQSRATKRTNARAVGSAARLGLIRAARRLSGRQTGQRQTGRKAYVEGAVELRYVQRRELHRH